MIRKVLLGLSCVSAFLSVVAINRNMIEEELAIVIIMGCLLVAGVTIISLMERER